MYKPPIELYTTDLQTKINEHADGVIMEAVKGIAVDVNKEELIRALQYDRHQYEKGYADGMKEFAERLKLNKAIHYCVCGRDTNTADMFNRHIDFTLKEMECE